MHLKLRREHKEGYMEEKARWGLDYRIVNQIMGSLEGGYSLFQRCVNLDAQ